MSNFLAEATVAVRADTSLFVTQLTKAVKDAEKQIVKIKIAPDPAGFVQAVNTAIREAQPKIIPIKVKMLADPTGFAASVRAAALAAAEGVNVPVKVTPTGGAVTRGAAGVTGGGGVVDRRAAQAQLAIAAATDAGVAARRRFDKAIDASDQAMLRDARIATQLKTATDAVTAATKAGVPALLAEAEALHLTAIRASEANAARKVRAAAPAARAAEEAAAAAAAVKATEEAAAAAAAAQVQGLQRIAAASADVLRASRVLDAQQTEASAKRIAALEAELRGLVAVDKAEDDARRKAIGDARRARITGRARTGAVIGDEAVTRNQAFEDSARSAAAAETDFANARRASARAAVLSNEPEKALAATRAAQRAAIDEIVEREIALGLARKTEISTLIELREAELAAAQARLADAAAAEKEAAASVAAAGRVGAGRRALEAFAANLAGLRGAALSAQGAFVATAAAAIAVTKAVQSAAEFESTINVFRVTAGATADEMERVRSVALDLGKDITLPGVGAQDAAQALTELSKAGLSVQDSIDGARGVLQLATAASIDNQQATELAASALNSFGLAGNQAVRVADTLANAANASQGSIVDIGVALQQASAVARQAGLTLEQTVGALTLFARAGLRGSDAGTSFRTAMIRLINPTAKAQKEIDRLGLHLRTSTGAINLDVFSEFAEKTRDFTAAQRDQSLAIIFGQDAIRGAAILAREGAEGLDEQIAALGRQGTAAELANARMTGFTGSMENLKNQLSATGITLGTVLIPPLKILADTISFQIGLINDFAQSFLDLADAAKRGANAVADFIKREAGGLIPDQIGPVDPEKDGKNIGEKIAKGIKIGAKQVAIEFIAGPVTPVVRAKQLAGLFSDSETDAKKVALQVREILAGLKGTSEVAQGLAFTEVVAQLTKLQEKLAGGDKDAQHLASEISDIITQLKEGNTLPPFAFPKVELPPDLKGGLPGKQAGDAIARAFDAALPGPKIFGITFEFGKNIKDGLEAGLAGVSEGVNAALDIAQRAIEEKLNAIGRQARLRLGALQSEALQLQVQGASPQELLANAQKQLGEATTALNLGVSRKLSRAELDKRRKEVIAAQNLVKGFQDDIAQNAAQVKADAEEKARKIQTARDAADKAILDSFAPTQASLQQRASRAAGTESVRDDRAAAIAQRKQLQSEIKTIDQNFNDRKAAAAEIAKRRDQIIQLNNDIKKDTAQIQQSAFEQQQTRLERRQSVAASFGDITAQRRIITRRIKLYNELIREFKGEKSALQKLKDARDDLEQDRKALRSQGFQAQVDLAQSIFDLTGNKNPLLKALNAQIRDQLKQIAAAKKAGHSTVALRTALFEMLTKRKQVLEDAVDASKEGTTAFDLLKQFSETFNNVAGNLINTNQPFAGPTGFTADIAQFLKRPQGGGAPAGIGPKTIESSNDALTKAILRLIDSMDANTDARGGHAPAGNRSTAKIRSAGGEDDRAFWKAAAARAAAEAGG